MLFYITFKAIFVLKIFNFFSGLFGHVEKCFYKESEVNKQRLVNVSTWETNNYNTHKVQYFKK